MTKIALLLTPLVMFQVGCANFQTRAVPNQSGTVIGAGCDLCATIGDRVFFDFDSARLSPESETTLKKQAAFLNEYPKATVLVAGNCDERGTEEYDLALGTRRASASRDFLVAQGVFAGRISIVSYGKERPAAAGANERAWAKNRNATTSVVR